MFVTVVLRAKVMPKNPTSLIVDNRDLSPDPIEQVCTEQTGLPYTVNRVVDAIADHPEACLIVASAIATSAIIWAVSEATIKVIRSLRS